MPVTPALGRRIHEEPEFKAVPGYTAELGASLGYVRLHLGNQITNHTNKTKR